MNALANHYGERDGRHPAACLIDAVVAFVIEELSDARGGVITLFPINELEDLTAVYRSECGSVLIAQMSIQDLKVHTVDLLSDDVDAVVAAITGKTPSNTPP